jgi:hypothetical protein
VRRLVGVEIGVSRARVFLGELAIHLAPIPVVWPAAAWAQQSDLVRRIGVLVFLHCRFCSRRIFAGRSGP